MRKLLLLCIICTYLPFVSKAQHNQYQFLHLNVNNGLSNNHVSTIFKDSRGFMWFGTMAGLNRYDGTNFKVFRHEIKDTTSIDDDNVLGIVEGGDKKLWIKTKSGINIYDPQTERFTHNIGSYIKSPSIPSSQIANVFVDKGIFLFTDHVSGIYLYNPATNKTSHFTHKNNDNGSINNEPVNTIAPDSRNNLWIMHNNGILEKFDRRLNKVIFRLNIAPGTVKLPYYTFFMDRQDGIWIFSPGDDIGVYYFDSSRSVLRHFNNESSVGRLNANIIYSVAEDNDGKIWIGTDHGGVDILDKSNFNVQYLVNRENDNKSLAQNSVLTIYKDNLGIMWIGAFKKGINYYHKNIIKFPIIQHYSSDKNSLPFNDINRFAEDKKGNLWIGTNGGGLIYFDRSTGLFKQYRHNPNIENSLCNDIIVSLCVDHEQKLWIGTFFGGMDCFDGKRFKHYKHSEADPSSLSDDRVWEIMEDSEHRLWVGTLAGGLNRFDSVRGGFIHYKSDMINSIHSNYISSIVEDKAGSIWLSTAWGIDVIKRNGEIKHYLRNVKDTATLILNNITNLFIDSRGWVWATTREGLSVLNPKTDKVTNFRKENGLPDNNVLDVIEDNKHNVWISSTNGLSNIIISNSRNQISYQINNYGESDGLQGSEFNESASLKTHAGELVFGGANGFNIFDPSNVIHIYDKPTVVLTDLQLFNKSIQPGQVINGREILSKSITETKLLTLKYNENVFSIEFAALDFFNPGKIRIQYILDDFDKTWITADNKVKKATYTNLDPGNYIFRIKAVNGALAGKELALQIVVKPPFWKTRIAYLLYFLTFSFSLYMLRRQGINKIRAQFAVAQEREEARRLHELDMMKIKFFTNISHEFRTPLSLIFAPADKILKQTDNPDHKKQLQLINRNARRLLNLVNQLLDFRKMETQELKLYTKSGDIIKFIEELTSSFSDISEEKNIGFVFDSDVESFETKFDHDKIERIIFNLLSNAFKFTPEYGHISVLLNLQEGQIGEGMLEIKIIDTGIGIPAEKQDKIFERFFQNEVPGFMVNQGSGIGLAITKEFVKLHKGEIKLESEEGQGSCFTVILPVNSNRPNIAENPGVPLVEQLPANVNIRNVNGKKHTVLLIEDDDDFRFYLKDNLKEHFYIIEAANGKEGWQKALALHPQLVVSDVNMPGMNGVDLCSKLKSDSRTKHIPIVLLTALTGEEQQLAGLTTGASDYMTKPFNFEILLSKLKNILLQQDLMRFTYVKQVEVNPSEVVVESPDAQFVQKALRVIERNISNTEFSVEELSSEMCMSRVTLYKRTLALTGKSPVELIRTVRLKRAVQLLEHGYLTVSQVSYKVGFKSHKYFTKSFKSEYNILSSEYHANKKSETIE